MLTLLEQINQKLPQASESVLQEVLVILSSANSESHSLVNKPNEDLAEFAGEFEQWEAASEEDCANWEAFALKEAM
jgi:hypothetical protein